MLDFDNTDIPLHGMQEGRFYHAYYDEYCYLPLYVFCGRDFSLLARQRCANVADSDGQRSKKRRGSLRRSAKPGRARAHNPAGRQWVLQRW